MMRTHGMTSVDDDGHFNALGPHPVWAVAPPIHLVVVLVVVARPGDPA